MIATVTLTSKTIFYLLEKQNMFLKIRRCMNIYTLSFKRNRPGRLKTLTEENQHDRLKESTTPLARFPYEVQLQIKTNALVKALQKIVNIIKFNRSNANEFFTNFAKVSQNYQGCICPFIAMKPSPKIEAFRNKEELNIKTGADGEFNTVGLVIGRGDNHVCVPCDRLPNSKPLHLEVVKIFKLFLHQSQFRRKMLSNNTKPDDHWIKLMIRSNEHGDVMLVPELSVGEISEDVRKRATEELCSYYSNPLHQVKSLHLRFRLPGQRMYHSQLHLLGDSHIYETVLGYHFRISPQAFFQLNTPAAEVLYSTVQDLVKQCHPTAILDIGCGTGTIGILTSSLVDNVVGLDSVPEAIKDAEYNAQMNGVRNATFITGGARKILKGFLEDNFNSLSTNTLAIVNPNRNGISKKAIERLRSCDFVKHLIYISCKPHGNAVQNFVDLIVPESEDHPGSPFVAMQATGVDMFPQTVHSELVLLFQR